MRQNKYFFLTVIGFFSLIASALMPAQLQAENDTRTITLYETHLRETTTVTFKRNGKFIPAGMKKLSYVLRDWRTGDKIRINPKLIDTIWELHKELGSTGPVHIVSGYRSPRTNAKLRRRGGGQAKRSQHMLGNAMDVRFPGVSTKKLRAAAMKKERGGVGYYASSRFVHVDVAGVRAWPRMSRYQLAMLFPYKATRHRPSSGGPLTRRDRYKARIRLAKLGKGKRGHSHGGTFLARAKKGASSNSVVMARNSRRVAPRSKLWVNAGNNKRFAALDNKVEKQHSHNHNHNASQPDDGNERALKKKIMSILAEFSKGSEETNKQDNTAKAQLASLTEQEANMDEFRAQKVGYAPIYNDEDPEEVAFQPFSLSPIITAQILDLQEPAYDKVDLDDGGMIFSARFTKGNSLSNHNWSSEFKGKAVRNLIGRQAFRGSIDNSYMQIAATN